MSISILDMPEDFKAELFARAKEFKVDLFFVSPVSPLIPALWQFGHEDENRIANVLYSHGEWSFVVIDTHGKRHSNAVEQLYYHNVATSDEPIPPRFTGYAKDLVREDYRMI